MATAEEIRAQAQASLQNQTETGVVQQPPPAEVKAVLPEQTGKAYFHQIPGSRFHYTIGPAQLGEIIFYGGMHITNDPLQIAELDKVVDRPGSMIYSARVRIDSMPADQRMAAQDAMQAAIAAHAKMIAAGEKVA